MTQEGTQRKLAAILSADVKEYSRLMSQDERGTIRTLTTYKEAMSSLIQEYKGRVVDSPGDNLLAEFGSVVDAVNCAVEIQRELAERNTELPAARQMDFRIGINLGDIVEEEKRIYGDGVNIAARLEGMAEGGGICISGNVHEQVKNKIGLEYEYLGEQAVKNIPEPVHAYRVLSVPGAAAHRVTKAKLAVRKTWRNAIIAVAAVLFLAAGAWAIWNFYFRPPPIEPASVEKMAYPLPDKPSIAVLPFENLSDDPAQENIVDGITDAIITGLSRTPEMFVVARNSVFTYKGKPVKVKKVSEDLGVRYVLEGSVQKEGDRLRINAQLIDAIKGHHLWAQKYDRDLKDLFALQDEITMKVITELQVKLTEGEYARMLSKGTKNIEAYLKYLKALQVHRRGGKENNLKSRKMFEEIIALDPNYPRPHMHMGYTYFNDAVWLGSKSPKEDLVRAEEFARKALELDDSLGLPHGLLANIWGARRQWDKALAEAKRAVSMDPNALNMYCLARTLMRLGRHEESVAWWEKVLRLNPYPPAFFLAMSGNSYLLAGRYQDALAQHYRELERAKEGDWSLKWAHLNLAHTYAMLGQDEKARYHVEELLKIYPKASCKWVAELWLGQLKNQADVDLFINASRKAGLPEKPPMAAPEKPSIAVLPFANIIGDPKEDYLSDGITEQIITALSKTPKMLVIARNSVFTYKGKPVMVQQVSEELGVRYVLEGSVQKSGDRLRITAQLIDAKTGNHIWSDRYDRELKDLFALQDEITVRVIEGLRVKLTQGEQGRIYSRGTDNLEAYLKVLKGFDLMVRFRSKEETALGRQMYEEAIALDPGYSNAYALLAWTHLLDMNFGWTKTPKKSLKLGLENAQKAVALDDSNPTAHTALENIYRMMGMPDKALAAGKQAIALAPNGADTNALHSYTLLALGRNEEALATINKAIHLNPIPPNWYLLAQGLAYQNTGQYEEAITAYKKALLINPKYLLVLYRLGIAYRMVGQYEDAIAALKKVIHLNPNYLWAHIDLAASYSLTGQEEKAHAEAKEALRISPKFSVDRWAKTGPGGLKSFRRDQKDIYITALRKAGLK